MTNALLQRTPAWLLGLALAAGVALPVRASGQTLEIAVLDNNVQGVIALSVLQRAYGKLGITLKTQALPLRRGVQMANAGEIDGDLMHTMASLAEWDGLVMISVPVVRAVFAAYKLGSNCPRSLSAADLASKRIAYMRGTRAVELVLPTPLLQGAINNLDALRNVQRGVSEYAVVGQMETDALIIKHGLPGEICKVAEPVASADLYHSLNKKHAALAERLERVMKEMRSQGEIARIWAEEGQRAREAIIAAP